MERIYKALAFLALAVIVGVALVKKSPALDEGVGYQGAPYQCFGQLISSVTTTSTPVTLFAADPYRRKINCFTPTSNTDDVICSWDFTAASTSTIMIYAGSNYWEAVGVSTTAFSCVSKSGSQPLRCQSCE